MTLRHRNFGNNQKVVGNVENKSRGDPRREKFQIISWGWGLGILANERAGNGPCDQSEAPGKLESWCFLRRENECRLPSLSLSRGNMERIWNPAWDQESRCSETRRDLQGEKKLRIILASNSRICRWTIFIFPRKHGCGGRMSPGLNRR